MDAATAVREEAEAWRAGCSESCTSGSGRGSWKREGSETRDQIVARAGYLLHARYVFELDPLAQLAENRRGSAYHYLMIEPDTRFYYSENDWDYEAVSVADVAAMGLEFQPEASPRPEHRGKGIVLGYR